jgi:chorismate-pyruvate lyase
MPDSSPSERSILHPLDDFYRVAGRPLPPHQSVTPSDLPEPARTLLVHNRDMTSTLEQFHQGRIHLRVLSFQNDGIQVRRQVVLRLDQSEIPVEFGATWVNLDRFAEPWRSQIVASQRPLGGILNASGQRYVSRPSAFFRIIADDFLQQALGLTHAVALFGRQNTLRTPEGLEIAGIVEILPPGDVSTPRR